MFKRRRMPMLRLGRPDLSEGEVRILGLPFSPPPWRFVLVSRADGRFVAYWNVCRHIPVPLDGGAGFIQPGPEWMCTTHGARFRPRDGLCVQGPCLGERLHALKVLEEDGWLWAEPRVPRRP